MSAQAPATCAFCPKACRFACPVSEAAGSESLSTWGKMTAVYLGAQHQRPLDAETALALHACTGCLRCTEVCAHQAPVARTLFEARGGAAAGAVRPPGAASTVATFTRSGNPFGVELAPRLQAFRPEHPVHHALFPGCSALVKHPRIVEQTVAVSAAFGAPMGVAPLAGRCCGYPLHAAGERQAFVEHARAFAEAAAHTPELVVLDPGCAYTLLRLYPEAGVRLATRVRTVVSVLAEHLLHAPGKPPLPLEVGYHDACHLGRGLGEYDAPRALLARAVRSVHEAPSCREQGGCAGGGGLLPRTMPALALEVAARQARQVQPPAAPGCPVVTACPTSRRQFERAGSPALDLVELLHRWLEAP
jgi:Fe-S oxidoreductase